MLGPFHAVLELLAVVVVAVAEIAVPHHVATRALNESTVQFSITLVAAAKVGRSKYLNNAHAAISDLAGCSGRSKARQMCRNTTSTITVAVAAAGSGASARRQCGIVFEAKWIRRDVAHRWCGIVSESSLDFFVSL